MAIHYLVLLLLYLFYIEELDFKVIDFEIQDIEVLDFKRSGSKFLLTYIA